jgi:hypothetical protein
MVPLHVVASTASFDDEMIVLSMARSAMSLM